jgi:hypothetical protein
MDKGAIMSLLACTTLASAAARAEPVKLLPGPFELPERIGPMRFDGKPHKYDDPRLGASYQYLGGGLSLTVYVYDLGAENIPDGGDTRLVCEAFEGAKGDVMRAGYQDVVVKTVRLARLDPTAESPVAREAVFEFTRDNRPTVSYLWLTGASKEFVKLRFSVDEKYRDELGEARRTVLDTLGEALKPHLEATDPHAEKNDVSVNVNPANDKGDMAAGLAYLMSLTADGTKHPESQPLCGGELVPDYASELAAFQKLVTVTKESGRPGKFTRRLADVADAGFLDELVWTDRHREEWGTQPPGGLELEAFEEWRRKKLKRFTVPDFGTVSYDSPRPLPLEPAAAGAP